MKLTIKTLQGKQLPIEVPDGSTVQQLKELINTQYQFPVETMKLIAYGKILEDGAKQVTEYAIKEGDFIVMMQ